MEMRVYIDCVGCEKMIRKSLQNMKGVDTVDIDTSMQKVTVTGWADQKKILKRVRKNGRRAELWQFPLDPILSNQNQNQNHPNANANANGVQYNMHYAGPATYHATPLPASSYNYHKHGYHTHQHSYYPDHSANSSIFGRVGDALSDESVQTCFIM